jgi:pimeloyl-ACP methyl ester carboxylesterase
MPARPLTVDLRGEGGVLLRADIVGEPGAPPVLLLHGGGQTRHAWGSTAQRLADRGWRAFSIDLRGHGDSEWPADADYRRETFAGDVVAIATALDQPPALVGASLGGIASLLAVGRHPRLASSLVLVDVSPYVESAGVQRIVDFMTNHMEDGFGSLEEVADAIATYNPHRPRPTNLAGLSKNVRQRDDGRWIWHWDPRFMSLGLEDETRALRATDLLEKAARSVAVPVLLVRGRMSDLLSEEGVRRFLDLVPNAEFTDVEGAGHMVAGDRNDAFNDAIIGFIEKHRPSGRSR